MSAKQQARSWSQGAKKLNPFADYARLRERVAQLEQDIQESRQLNRRLAEITDVVAEVLLPAEQRDETRLRELLASYDKAL